MSQNCNLVPEFNGLVSKRVNRKIDPFYFLTSSFIFFLLTLFFHSFILLLRYFLKDYSTDVFENLTLFNE